MRLHCRRLLEAAGHEVIEANDGKEALSMYQEHQPDAVLLDFVMPDEDGVEVLKEIRKADPKARVAMLTGNVEESVVRDAVVAGARDFVAKPFDDARVLSAVAHLLE